jgi:NADPH-dependent 2,4-dienoyl-CoA reductase/sulfur reductase-like enzyme
MVRNMKHYDLLIIGGVAAGMSAASQARRIKKDISIGVFEKNNFVSYAACGMPYFIGDVVTDQNKLIAIDKDKFINERNIQIFTESCAEKIIFAKKQVEIKHKDRAETYTYDKLVIATGARAVIPPIKGVDSKNVFPLRNLDEGLAIKKYIQTVKSANGIIIGGGPIGLEMAESLRTLGIETVLLEKMDDIALAFDKEIRDLIIEELKKNNVTTKTKVNIKEIIQDKDKLKIQLDSETLLTDFIIVSVGILPNTDFLKGTELRMNERGAIIVNEKSGTNIPDVYSAGDCATAKHLILLDDVYMPLGTTSNKQGRVAGLQAAGIHNEIFKGIVGTQLIKVFDLELGKTGLSEADAKRSGINAKSSGVNWRSRAGYYPGAKNIFVKLTINNNTHELIGGQVAGEDGAALRTNVVAAAITSKMKIEDFAYLDLGYAPPFSPVWDSLHAAAQNLISR